MKRAVFLCILVLSVVMIISSCDSDESHDRREVEKPIIYLYPTEETDVSVKLEFDGKLEFTYPEYNDGWDVKAFPDGRLLNNLDGREYECLFWEGSSNIEFDFNKGFVVKGEDTAEFLQKTLGKMGLTAKEYNEFIVYWLPRMKNNKYNLIAFQGELYNESAKLKIEPKPDSILRVFMAFKALDDKVDIEPQQIKPFARKGFTVIEWGGSRVE